jgi:hypothetical protein
MVGVAAMSAYEGLADHGEEKAAEAACDPEQTFASKKPCIPRDLGATILRVSARSLEPFKRKECSQ